MLGFSSLSQAPLSSLGSRSGTAAITGDESTFALSAPSIIGKANVTPASATGVFATGTLTLNAAGQVTIGNVNVTLEAGTPEVSLAKRITLASNLASLTNGGVTPKGSAQVQIAAVRELSALGRVNLGTPTAIQFEYDPDVYSRARTIILSPFKTDNYTVHIQPHHATLYMSARDEAYTVHIQPESYTVYIEGHADDRTVYVI